MFDCPKCWETPCVCGHEYKDRTAEWINKLIRVLQAELKRRDKDN